MDARPRLERVDWRVYVILDPRFLPARQTLLRVAEASLAGGAGVLQLRDKDATAAELVAAASVLASLCERHGALFIVNDRLDVALASGAHGVHLGPEDVPVALARRVAPSLVIGGSAGTAERARELVRAGADYLGCGALYEARPAKANASAPRGPALVRDVTDAVDVPVVGIGGITAASAAEVVAAGARGVAVIREVVASEDPQEAVRRLREAATTGSPCDDDGETHGRHR